MSLIDIVKTSVPDPYNKDSTLPEQVKRGEILKGILPRLPKPFANSFVTLFVIVIITVFLKIPFQIVLIFFGFSSIFNILGILMLVKKLKDLYKVNANENGKSYRNILIISARYQLYERMITIVGVIVGIVLILLFFPNELYNFSISGIPHQDIKLKDVILVFFIFKFISFVIGIIQYVWVTQLKGNVNVADVNRDYQILNTKIEMLSGFIFISLMFLILYLLGIPLWIILIFEGWMLIIIIGNMINNMRIKKVKFDDNAIDPTVVRGNILEIQNEQIVYPVFGIMKTMSGLGDVFKPVGFSFMGVGKVYYPENTMLITDHRILLVQVPVTGGNMMVGEVNYVNENFFYNRKEIIDNGSVILQTKSLAEILKFAIDDVKYCDITSLKLKQSLVIIETSNGEKLNYLFMDREHIEPLKEAFGKYLNGRFSVE